MTKIRAARRISSHQRFSLACGAGLGVATLLLILVSPSHKTDQAELHPTPPPPEFADAMSDTNTVVDTLRSGEILSQLMSSHGISPRLTQQILSSLEPWVDPRRCLPGHILTIRTNTEGELISFEYQRSPEEIFQVVVENGSMIANRKEIHVENVLSFVDGSIENSLYQSIVMANEDPSLAYDLADILSWDIDFYTEPRPGDRFRMIVTKHYLDGTFLRYGPILAAEYVGAPGTFNVVRFESSDGTTDYYNLDGSSVRRCFLKSPLRYRRISSGFSLRRFHPILKIYRPHYGVDYAAPTGTPVSAIGDGVVTFCGWKGGYGRYISIKHSNAYVSGYGHLSRYAKGIKKGVRVTQGQLIGYVGSTGLTTGPHLDFSMKKNGRFVNPLRVNPPSAEPVKVGDRDAFEKTVDRLVALLDGRSLLTRTHVCLSLLAEDGTQ